MKRAGKASHRVRRSRPPVRFSPGARWRTTGLTRWAWPRAVMVPLPHPGIDGHQEWRHPPQRSEGEMRRDRALGKATVVEIRKAGSAASGRGLSVACSGSRWQRRTQAGRPGGIQLSTARPCSWGQSFGGKTCHTTPECHKLRGHFTWGANNTTRHGTR